MALDLKPSRFAVLPDDVPDVVGKKQQGASSAASKAKKKKATDAKKAAAAGANQPKKNTAKKPTLKSMAFGGTADGKKKGGNPAAVPVTPIQIPEAPSTSNQPVPQNGTKLPNKKPPGITTQQWEEWQQRDRELVTGTYESDLEAALIQSQLQYQNELVKRQTENPQGKSKTKKKPVAVPLNEFNVKLLEKVPNGEIQNGYVDENDENAMEKFRAEARLELERAKHLAEQRELISSRQTEGVYKHPNSRSRTSDPKTDEKNLLVDGLKLENDQLRAEVELHKDRLKKLYEMFQAAQDVKDKAKLLYQVENLTKLNEDLTVEVRDLHSQLEQERSKSHAALNECRKLTEQSRRRTNTETSS